MQIYFLLGFIFGDMKYFKTFYLRGCHQQGEEQGKYPPGNCNYIEKIIHNIVIIMRVTEAISYVRQCWWCLCEEFGVSKN